MVSKSKQPTMRQGQLFSNAHDTLGTGVSGYDAANASQRRSVPVRYVKAEDDHLKRQARRTLMATAKDLQRNFALAAWAIRKHLDFVASHYFTGRNDDDAFNKVLEEFVANRASAENFDIRGRHSLRDGMRLIESARVVDGDIFVMRVRRGQVQFIESDRVQDPPTDKQFPNENNLWFNGVLVDPQGRLRRVAVYSRNRTGGYQYERLVRAENIWQVGYFSRFDQVRGISPMASGINTFRDVYENIGYAVAKSKIAQLFGMKITRESTEGFPGMGDEAAPEGQYEVDFGKGPAVFDMNPGDDVSFLENKTPSVEFQEFMRATISVALKALDIPYSFFDEGYTNFFGSRAAFTLYIKSANHKQRTLQEWLREWTLWQFSLGVANGTLVLPPGYDSVNDIMFDWLPDGLPWWDPQKEIDGNIKARNAGFTTLDAIVRQHGGPGEKGNWRAIIDQIAIENEYAESRGVTLTELNIGETNDDSDTTETE